MLVFSFDAAPHDTDAAASEGAARLTPAERAVAAQAARGASNEEIAARRGTTERTVRKQLDAVYRKLGVRSRVELALDPRASKRG